MAKTSKAQLEANAKYKKKMMVNKTVSFYKKGDADILKFLETYDGSFSGLVKELIRKNIENDGKESSII